MADRSFGRTADLLNHQSEWGLTVSEGAGRRTVGKRAMIFGAYVLFGAAAVLAMPVLAGFLFFPESQGITMEVIVADGGSTDATREFASQADARIVSSQPGRGRQMNGKGQADIAQPHNGNTVFTCFQ